MLDIKERWLPLRIYLLFIIQKVLSHKCHSQKTRGFLSILQLNSCIQSHFNLDLLPDPQLPPRWFSLRRTLWNLPNQLINHIRFLLRWLATCIDMRSIFRPGKQRHRGYSWYTKSFFSPGLFDNEYFTGHSPDMADPKILPLAQSLPSGSSNEGESYVASVAEIHA